MGAAVGVVLALGLTRYAKNLLFGVSGELLFRQPVDQNAMLHCIENLPPYQFARDTSELRYG